MSVQPRPHRPSHATVVAYLALFVALSSGAWAAANIGAGNIKPNAIRSRHIKNGQVKGVDVDESSLDTSVLQARVTGTCLVGEAIRVVAQDGTVTCQGVGGGGSPTGPAGGDLAGSYPDPTIAANAVDSGKVLDDTLTGADINESTLDQVPSAITAINANTATDANAVDGQSATTFNFNADFVPSNFTYTQILNFGGLKLEANCSRRSGGAAWLQVAASTDTDNSFIRSSVGSLENSDFDIADGPAIVFRADSSNGNGTILYRRGNDTNAQAEVTSVTFAWIRGSAGKPCQFEGTVIGH